MRMMGKFSLLKLPLALASLALFSCSKQTDVNKTFNKKYSEEVKFIKSERTFPESKKKEILPLPLPSLEEFRNSDDGKLKNTYRYRNIARFADKKDVNTSPNNESYENLADSNVPPNVFEANYNTSFHVPFRRAGVEFDYIEIPERDVYGVKTAMSDKHYLFPGNASLKKNIIQIKAEQTSDDIENSETIIKEQRLLKRKQRMIRNFGSDSSELTPPEKNNEKSNVITKSDKKSDNIKKLEPSPIQQDQQLAPDVPPSTIKN